MIDKIPPQRESNIAATEVPSEEGGNWEQLKGVAPIIAIFLAFLVGLWLALSNDSGKGKGFSGKKDYGDSLALLQKASALLSDDHLTLPKGDSALDAYLEILDDYPKLASAKDGVKGVGERYIYLLEKLIQQREFVLSKALLVSAGGLKKHLKGAAFSEQLSQLEANLSQLERIRRSMQIAKATSFKPLQVFYDDLKAGGKAPNMVFIPAGAFVMGSPEGEVGRDVDEGPQTTVTVHHFAMGITEVSFNDFKIFTDSTSFELPSDNGWGYGDQPVINISWQGAKAYAAWLSDQTGFHYRLPTEVEWEYAARAGSSNTFSSEPCLVASEANFDGREPFVSTCPDTQVYLGKTVAVKAYQANPWGLYQTHGNAREWLEDCWIKGYANGPVDSRARYTSEGGSCGSSGKRILRGGAWSTSMRTSRTANRFAAKEEDREPSFGLRLARDVD